MFAYIANPYKKGEKPSKGGHGWIKVLNEATKSFDFLPMYLKILMISVPEGANKEREYFRVEEGVHRGKMFSLSFIETKENCWFYFISCTTKYRSRLLKRSAGTLVPRKQPCVVRYQKVKSTKKGYAADTEHTTLQVGHGLGDQFKPVFKDLDVVHQFDLLKPGKYGLMIPDYEHVNKGAKYLDESLFATTWYLIDEPLYRDDITTVENEIGKKARYFHPGRGSAGCLTIRSRRKWSRVVEYISQCRVNTLLVGYVEVLEVRKTA